MKIIEEEINKFLQCKYAETDPRAKVEDCVKFFYCSQMSSQYQQEEKNLRHIMGKHLNPKQGATVNISIYYKSRKLSNLFIKNNIHKDLTNSHVVYRYDCPEDMCKQSQFYIGYTTTTLKQRMTLHAQHGGIISHHKDVHQIKTRTADILNHISVIFRASEKMDLLIAEALFIKEQNPPLNNQREGEKRVLSVF